MKRTTTQSLLPIENYNVDEPTYNLYPSFELKNGTIFQGYETLSTTISDKKVVFLEGYLGVDWDEVIQNLKTELTQKGLSVESIDIRDYMKADSDIYQMVKPFLGKEDSIFGYKTNLNLIDFFKSDELENLQINPANDITLIYGTGSSLCKLDGFLVYFDLPKNELQYRMRAQEVFNLGYQFTDNPKAIYKGFYFIDWVVLNKHKKHLLPSIDIIVDQQRPLHPTWTQGEVLRKNLEEMSRTHFRVRPWFEPGVWGGNWMKDHFQRLNKNVPNYAWSFEMIVPENGLLFENNQLLLEVSFDMLMFQEQQNVLGKAAQRFKDEFPIRFDFLDTFDGGNLSVQCHPTNDYIQKQFGENFTQDETYYILDAGKDAEVYLGFQDDIEPKKFRDALEESFVTKKELEVEKYVQKFPAKKHDLFLIPNGTVHCSGIDNMVLEISATPYIFTFKMYDWQRLDLDGQPRPLNIEHAFNNLDFSRKGQVVEDTLISKPYVEENGPGWKKFHLPTHPDHFYNIYRYEFEDEIEIDTNDQCHILMLVEGQQIELRSTADKPEVFKYAETFAIPAAARKYRLLNKSNCTAKIIMSHVKNEAC